MCVGPAKRIRNLTIVLLLSAPLVTLSNVYAEQLPIKTYTTADGLARDDINRIVRDSHGFLWFCTEEGLSRFDGYKFINYTMDQGLPHRRVADLVETRSGAYWLATGAGVCRFDPGSNGQIFTSYSMDSDKRSQKVNVLIEDDHGVVWSGTDRGIFRMREDNGELTFESVDIGLPLGIDSNAYVSSLQEDRSGALWIGTAQGLYRRFPDGRAERFSMQQGLPSDFVQSLIEDSTGRMWAGMRYGGLCLLVANPDTAKPVVARLYTMKDGLAANWIWALFESSDKGFWVGTTNGLSALISVTDTSGHAFRSYTTAQGLIDPEIGSLAEDRDGSLWLGTGNSGAMKMAWNGFTTFGEADGLKGLSINSILEDADGRLCVISSNAQMKAIDQFDGHRFNAMPMNEIIHFKQRIDYGWGTNQIAVQDVAGEWWIDTAKGLFRFPGVNGVEQLARVRPKAIYTSRNGLGGDDVFRIFEDSRGDMWVGTFGDSDRVLTRWERATDTLHRYTGLEKGLSAPTAFREDASGNIWIAFFQGGLARCNANTITLLKESDGVPRGQIRALYLDSRGRLWLASSQSGIARIDDPSAERPGFVRYTAADGLSSNDVWCLTEDQWGRIYAGTGRGLDRLDPASGHVNHYTAADGLARGKVMNAFRDHKGALWFGTADGLSRLVPAPDRLRSPPPIVISGLRVAGKSHRVSELGATEVSMPDLTWNQNDVQIEFVGLGFGTGEVLRYQYILEGAEADWNAPGDQRTVSYASLRPGRYRFVVRAVNADGIASSTPATVTFTILSPIWQRWWFLAIASIAVASAVYAWHRYRLGRLIELERVRTRIATDLHDDIGSSLSRMAILSEVVKQQLMGNSKQSAPMLTEIADSARGLVDSMSDIVWAIDPRRDNLSSVVTRVRQFASDVLEAKKIKWEFQVPPEIDNLKLDAEQRRHVFLIFKEAINNIARHADCRSVSMKIDLAHHQLVAEIQDDGSGFVVQQNGQQGTTNGRGGHGLKNMHRRAAQLGGRFSVHSSPGRGTHLKLIVPL